MGSQGIARRRGLLHPIVIHKSYLQKKFDGAVWLPSKEEREREGRHKKLASGVTMRSKDGDHDKVRGGLEAGAVVFVQGEQDATNSEPLAGENIYNSRTRAFTDRQKQFGETGTWFWFGEHKSPKPLPALFGGVAACTQLVTSSIGETKVFYCTMLMCQIHLIALVTTCSCRGLSCCIIMRQL